MTPRLPQVTAREVVAVLKQVGFEEHTQEGSHLILKNPSTNRRLVVPIHAGDMGRGLLKKIIKHAGLSEAEFRALL